MKKIDIIDGSVAILMDRNDAMRLRTVIHRVQQNANFRSKWDVPTNELLYWLADGLDPANHGA